MSAELEKITERTDLEIEGIVTDNWHRLSVDEKVERILESQKKELTLDKFLALFKGHEEEQLIDISDNLEESGVSLVEKKEETKEQITGIEIEDKEDGKKKEVSLQKPDDRHQVDSSDSFGLYLEQTGKVPLLNAQEEVELSIRIEEGTKAKMALSQESTEGELTEERKKELQYLIEDSQAAKEHLLTANTRLVISVAKKYRDRGVPFLDLIQEGNIGLIRAGKKFEHWRGHKFSTYATWWIRQAITRALADQGRTIRVPVHMNDKIFKMLRTNHQLTQVLGRDPTVEETAEALRESPKKVQYMIEINRRPLSLELPTNPEKSVFLRDSIEDEKAKIPSEEMDKKSLNETLMEIFEELPPREVTVLKYRFGLVGGRTHTLKEVGQKFGVTRERARQIEVQALRRLRHSKYRPLLVDFTTK